MKNKTTDMGASAFKSKPASSRIKDGIFANKKQSISEKIAKKYNQPLEGEDEHIARFVALLKSNGQKIPSMEKLRINVRSAMIKGRQFEAWKASTKPTPLQVSAKTVLKNLDRQAVQLGKALGLTPKQCSLVRNPLTHNAPIWTALNNAMRQSKNKTVAAELQKDYKILRELYNVLQKHKLLIA